MLKISGCESVLVILIDASGFRDKAAPIEFQEDSLSERNGVTPAGAFVAASWAQTWKPEARMLKITATIGNFICSEQLIATTLPHFGPDVIASGGILLCNNATKILASRVTRTGRSYLSIAGALS